MAVRLRLTPELRDALLAAHRAGAPISVRLPASAAGGLAAGVGELLVAGQTFLLPLYPEGPARAVRLYAARPAEGATQALELAGVAAVVGQASVAAAAPGVRAAAGRLKQRYAESAAEHDAGAPRTERGR